MDAEGAASSQSRESTATRRNPLLLVAPVVRVRLKLYNAMRGVRKCGCGGEGKGRSCLAILDDDDAVGEGRAEANWRGEFEEAFRWSWGGWQVVRGSGEGTGRGEGRERGGEYRQQGTTALRLWRTHWYPCLVLIVV